MSGWTASQPNPQILIFGFEGEMFFGAAAALEGHFETIESRIGPDTKVLVLRLKRVRNPDAVGMHLLDEHIHRIEGQGVHVLLVGVRSDLADALVAPASRAGFTPSTSSTSSRSATPVLRWACSTPTSSSVPLRRLTATRLDYII